MRIAIVGAGVVGLACAAVLRMRGHDVVLIDPRGPGQYCSFGNAGCLSRSSFVPLGMPGLWKKVPSYLLDRAGPLSIPLAHVPQVARWLWRMHRGSTLAQVNATADALFPLLDTTIDKWRPLAAWAGVPELIRQEGYAWAYESEAAFAADALGRELRRARGVTIDVLTGGAIQEYEPALSPRLTHLVVFPEQGHCPNPGRLSHALAQRLVAGGATFIEQAATGFNLADGRVSAVRTPASTIACDAMVIAAGAHSHELTAQLGTRVLLETERGYHVTLEHPSMRPRRPVMSAEGKFFSTAMEDGLRVAGTVELAGLNAPPNYDRTKPLVEGARRLFPGLTFGAVTPWMGHRPSLPDGRPVIGRTPRVANALLAFGHGHVGLTAAAPTAHVIADLVDGRAPELDIGAFSPTRDAVRA